MLHGDSGINSMSPPEIHNQIDRVTNSHAFRGSPSLCKLLGYLAAHALEQPGVSVKEYQVATEVFGRPSDFDPKEDSTVRVQAGRLRNKLHEYYSGEGANDDLVVDLPKGFYALEFHERGAKRTSESRFVETDVPNHTLSEAAHPPSQWTALSVILLIGLVATVVAAAYLSFVDRSQLALTAKAPAPGPLKTFWGAVLTNTDDPWVVF